MKPAYKQSPETADALDLSVPVPGEAGALFFEEILGGGDPEFERYVRGFLREFELARASQP